MLCAPYSDDDMLQESGIYTGQLMFLEVKKDDGTWPRDTYMQVGYGRFVVAKDVLWF